MAKTTQKRPFEERPRSRTRAAPAVMAEATTPKNGQSLSLARRLKAEQKAIGQRLRGVLEQRGLIQQDFAAQLGIDPSWLSAWIHGRRRTSRSWIERWVKTLPGTTYSDFDPENVAPTIERRSLLDTSSRARQNTLLPDMHVGTCPLLEDEGAAMLLRDPEALAIASTFVTLQPHQKQQVKELVHQLALEPAPGGARRRGGSARPRRHP